MNKFKEILQAGLDALDNDELKVAKVTMRRLENEIIRVAAKSLPEGTKTSKEELLKL